MYTYVYILYINPHASINIILYVMISIFFAQHQGFEGSIVAENFSSSDPSSNNPMMHGGLDNGGGLISFHRVSENFCCRFFFLSQLSLSKMSNIQAQIVA